MSLEENKAIVRRFWEAMNNRNHDALDELLAPDYFDPDYPQLQGLEGLKQMMNMYLKAFPDTHSTIDDIIAEGDKVWVQYTDTMTHTGEFMGIAPTGKKITLRTVDIYRIANGKIAWGRHVPTPNFAFFKQLCLIEYTEKGKKLFPDDVK